MAQVRIAETGNSKYVILNSKTDVHIKPIDGRIVRAHRWPDAPIVGIDRVLLSGCRCLRHRICPHRIRMHIMLNANRIVVIAMDHRIPIGNLVHYGILYPYRLRPGRRCASHYKQKQKDDNTIEWIHRLKIKFVSKVGKFATK